jgi:CorA-like Mg2+ transporter protein
MSHGYFVAAVVLLPPTLGGSVYGMNFEHMQELKWVAGYPTALVLMVLSAILPYLYFRHKGLDVRPALDTSSSSHRGRSRLRAYGRMTRTAEADCAIGERHINVALRNRLF